VAQGKPPKRSVKAREHLANWVRELGVKDPRISPNHAWRHLWKLQAERAGVPERLSDYLTGHAPASEGRSYGAPLLTDRPSRGRVFPCPNVSTATARSSYSRPAKVEHSMSDPNTVLHGFYDLCVEARSDFDLYRSLFEDDPTSTELCVNYAPYFFNDFSRIITRALVLHACKLTDPARTKGQPNLTTNYILEDLQWPNDVKDELNRLNDRLMVFRDKVKAARNKRIAHADLHSQVQHLEAMGTFDMGEDVKFFEDLENFVQVAFRHVQGDPVPTIQVGASTDTYKVIRAVEKAILYDRCPRCTAAQRANDVLDFEGR